MTKNQLAAEAGKLGVSFRTSYTKATGPRTKWDSATCSAVVIGPGDPIRYFVSLGGQYGEALEGSAVGETLQEAFDKAAAKLRPFKHPGMARWSEVSR